MGTLEDLGLVEDNTQVEIPDEIPEEGSTYIPLVQPGTFFFKLPDDMSAIWYKRETQRGPRITAGFTRENPLTVTGDSTGDYIGTPVVTFISNAERPRGRERVLVPDMFYLLASLEKDISEKELKAKLKTNTDYVTMLRKHEGREFQAEVHWEAYCSPQKNIWMTVLDENNNKRLEEQEGTPGCGASYNTYSRDASKRIPKDENGFMERFEEVLVHGDPDGCPATLNSQIRLSRYVAVVR